MDPNHTTNFRIARTGTCVIVAVVVICSKIVDGDILRTTCPEKFQGFGVYLGSINHLNEGNNKDIVQQLVDKLYFDLHLRYFRTELMPEFSPKPNTYEITCKSSSPICTWIDLHSVIADKSRYPGASFIASIWSPPAYMKDHTKRQLLPEHEQAYFHFIKNVTQIVLDRFGIDFEQISPVNEPENIFATWNHCEMDATQLCRLISTFNDTKISLCPENSYFAISKEFMKHTDNSCSCENVCKVLGTHGYILNLNMGQGHSMRNFGKAYYDHTVHGPIFLASSHGHSKVKPIWMTEVSSTFPEAGAEQMQEALDLASHIMNFVGTTCVQRYYYWFAFTNGDSGESLIWGRKKPGASANASTTTELYLPKKYFVYNHFTNATKGTDSSETTVSTLKNAFQRITFNENAVYLNKVQSEQTVDSEMVCDHDFSFCCTTENYDFDCTVSRNVLPERSVCSCIKYY